MAGVEWFFTLVDQASGPARNITKAIDGLAQATRNADQAAERVTASTRGVLQRIGDAAQAGMRGVVDAVSSPQVKAAFDSLLKSAKGVVSGIEGAFKGVGTAFRRVFNLPTALAGGFAALGGKVITDAIGWREATLSGLEILLGGQEQAAAVMDQIERLSGQLKLPMNVIAESMQDFLRTGKVTVGESEVMMRALAEVYAAKGFRPEVFEAAAEGMRFMLSQTRLSARQINPLLRSMGLNADVFEKALAGALGKAPGDIKKMLAEGAIAGKAGAQALVQTIQEQISKGDIGTMFEKQAQTLPGILRGIRTKVQDFFKGEEFLAMPGLEPFRRFLKNIEDMLGNPRIKQAAAKLIGELFTVLFGPLEKLTTPEGLEKFLTDLPRKVESLVTQIKSFGKGVNEGIKTLKWAWDNVLQPVLTGLGKLFGQAEGAAGKGGAEIAGQLTAIAAPLVVLGPIIGPLLGSLKALVGMGPALVGLLGPAAPFVLGIAALAAGLKLAYDNVPEFRNAMDSIDAAVSKSQVSVRNFVTGMDDWVAATQKATRGSLAAIDDWAAQWQQKMVEWIGRTLEWAKEAGGNLMRGLGEGITNAVGSVTGALGNLWNKVTGKVEQAADISSPSRVFMGYGVDMVTGLARGILGSTDLVERALAGLVPSRLGAPAAGVTAPAADGGRRIPAEISFTFNIDGAAAPRETADAVAESVTDALARWFDLLAQEGGGVPLPAPG